MRLTVDGLDYAQIKSAGNDVRIFLDDVEQNLCVEADDEQGFVRRVQRDASGRIVSYGGADVIERVEGRVRIEIYERPRGDAR